MTSHKEIVQTYFEGFRRSDHAMILDLLTEDVRWDLPGFRHLVGKAAFDGEIENESFEGSPTLVLDRLIAEGNVVIAIGTGAGALKGGPRFQFAYCDVFTFCGDLIERVESYLVQLPGEGDGVMG